MGEGEGEGVGGVFSRQVRGWGYAGQIGIGQIVEGNRKSKVSRSYVFNILKHEKSEIWMNLWICFL